MSAVDLCALAILATAILRGMRIGWVGESISLAALGASLIAVPVWTPALARWLQNPNGLSVRYDLAPWLAGWLVFMVVLVAVGAFGRMMRGNSVTGGHGRLDRVGGAALGMAEGVLAAGLLIFVVVALGGRDHRALAGSWSVALLELTDGVDRSPSPARTPPPVAAGPMPRPYVPPGEQRGPAARDYLTVLMLCAGVALVVWNRWTSNVVVHTITDLPPGVWPSQVQWIPSSEAGDRVRAGPLQRQEWHLVDRAKSTHLVLTWKNRD
jgi:uncharacterized membrane protein required for colicin V production